MTHKSWLIVLGVGLAVVTVLALVGWRMGGLGLLQAGLPGCT
ncbi:hypothetical protein [Castellaniella sp.]